MGNVFKTQEQREHWNAYNNEYSKRNYKTITFKLNKRTDKEIIDYIEQSGKTATVLLREFLKEMIKRKD